MFDAILKATNSSFQKGMTFCRSIYVKKVMKPLAFIFEQPSYVNRQLGASKPCEKIQLKILKFNSTFIMLHRNSCPLQNAKKIVLQIVLGFV